MNGTHSCENSHNHRQRRHPRYQIIPSHTGAELRKPLALLVVSIALLGASASASNTLTADEAKNHIGETATVCGGVAGTHYAASSRGNPTFVNVGAPYPRQPFTILIWGEDLPKFNPKPATWDGKRVCATGQITSYQGRPEIVAKAPEQISVGHSE